MSLRLRYAGKHQLRAVVNQAKLRRRRHRLRAVVTHVIQSKPRRTHQLGAVVIKAKLRRAGGIDT
eukprot:scaffold171568_cov23-Tisochrysis_lutea.AAC.5